MKTIAGYQVKNGTLLNAPCACSQCQEEGRQPGHKYCENVPAPLLEAQERGEIVANLDNAGWHWQVRRYPHTENRPRAGEGIVSC